MLTECFFAVIRRNDGLHDGVPTFLDRRKNIHHTSMNAAKSWNLREHDRFGPSLHRHYPQETGSIRIILAMTLLVAGLVKFVPGLTTIPVADMQDDVVLES